MHLSPSSIQEIKQMLLERAQILNLQSSQVLDLCSESHSIQPLTFPNEHFDLVLFHLDEQQLQPLNQSLQEFKRVLKFQGILLFACTGIEMHELGDALLKAGFADPVTDRETFEEEVIFAYAWRKPQSSYQLENGDVAIPISQLLTK